MKTSYIIKRLMPYLAKYKKLIIFDMLCAVAAAVSNIVSPMTVRYISNRIDSLTIEMLASVIIAYTLILAVASAVNFYMVHMGNVFGARVESDMRLDLFSHLQKLSYSFYAENSIGQIMARLTGDLTDCASFVHIIPEQLLVAGGTLIVSFIMLMRINIPLTLTVFAFLPLVFISTKYFNKRMRRAMKEQRVQVGEINSQIEDTLSGIRLVKSFTNENAEVDKFTKRNNLYLKIKSRTFFQLAGFQVTTGSLGGIVYIAVVALGAVFMMKGSIHAGDYAAYILCISTLWTCIRTLVGFTEQFQRGITGIERFLELMDTQPEITDIPNPKLLDNGDGSIEFKNVSFRYKGSDKNILSNISFKISQGENIALVGHSGGGKTTLINLIPRFYDVSEGEILINGENIRNLKISSIRQAIGIVQQDVYLFSGTVFENIVYGKLNSSRDEVITAAKQAGAHEFIMSLENGYDTYIGEHGVKLSGGQKQRISIARVFLKNPPILILDVRTGQNTNASAELSKTKKIIIGNHVWIGQDATLLYNTDIGDGSIVGTKSLVKGKFPNNCVIGGNPARLLKADIAWSRGYGDTDIGVIDDKYVRLTETCC